MAIGVLVALVAIAIAAPVLAPKNPSAIDPFNTLAHPSSAHLLGSDENGRDSLSRLIYGSRVSLVVGLISVSIAVLVGVPLGLAAGYAGGHVDSFIMRCMDAVMAFPAIMLALGIVAVLGSGLYQLMVAIGLTSVPLYARLVRSQVLSLKQQDFVMAARAVGVPVPRLLLRHILPNAVAPIVVAGSLGLAFAILAEAGLSFLGLGVPPPTPTWGGMLQKGLPRIYQARELSIVPGIAIFITVLALNIVGDALRDALDPRLRGRL
ncbi:MAG: ABC transporter permease [Dehalococcoidia bacterium]|nr:ABC transporter permease [Dehalococcoidia bacterium]